MREIVGRAMAIFAGGRRAFPAESPVPGAAFNYEAGLKCFFIFDGQVDFILPRW